MIAGRWPTPSKKRDLLLFAVVDTARRPEENYMEIKHLDGIFRTISVFCLFMFLVIKTGF